MILYFRLFQYLFNLDSFSAPLGVDSCTSRDAFFSLFTKIIELPNVHCIFVFFCRNDCCNIGEMINHDFLQLDKSTN